MSVGGLRLHYVDWGNRSAPPFVMLHGIDRVARTFDRVAPHFASRYHVIAMDLRGHGDSGWDPEGRYLVEDHVGDLEGLVRALGLRNVTLWGNSTGGRVVQVFAGLHPELVAAVIAEDVGPERPRSIADAYARRVKQEENGWAGPDELLARDARQRAAAAGGGARALRALWHEAAGGRPAGVEARSESGERIRRDRAVALRARDQGARSSTCSAAAAPSCRRQRRRS